MGSPASEGTLDGGACGKVCFGVERQLATKRRISIDIPISDIFFTTVSILTCSYYRYTGYTPEAASCQDIPGGLSIFNFFVSTTEQTSACLFVRRTSSFYNRGEGIMQVIIFVMFNGSGEAKNALGSLELLLPAR